MEIHEHSSDWLKHGHHTDATYDSVILHITSDADIDVHRTNGEPIPQLILTCPDYVCRNYHELVETESYPPCYRIIPTLSILRYTPGCLPYNWNVSNRKPRNYRNGSNVATAIGKMPFSLLWHAISALASTEMLLRLGQTGFLYGQ